MTRTAFVPYEIECFWCGKRMLRGTAFSSASINHVSYFCESCGAFSHFAVNDKKKICGFEIEYEYQKDGDGE